MQLFVHDPRTTISDEETRLQDFLAILKHSLQNSSVQVYHSIAISLMDLNIQQNNGVLHITI